MFIRFVSSQKVDRMAARAGFFNAAYELRENQTLDKNTFDQLEGLLEWFRQNLTVPPKFNRSKSKGAYRRNSKGLSWFRGTATEALEKSHQIIHILRQNGSHIEETRSDRIGYIVYEDDVQVIAEPLAGTPV